MEKNHKTHNVLLCGHFMINQRKVTTLQCFSFHLSMHLLALFCQTFIGLSKLRRVTTLIGLSISLLNIRQFDPHSGRACLRSLNLSSHASMHHSCFYSCSCSCSCYPLLLRFLLLGVFISVLLLLL